MILTKEQAQQRFEKPDPKLGELKKQHKKFLMHVHGNNLSDYLKKISGLENKQQIDLRQKYARSNKDLFSNILRPTDKVFSAKGGNKEYNISGDNNLKVFRETLSEITEGMSLSKWLQNYFLDKYAVDPNGVFLIENANSQAYPTYKAITSIRDYKASGQRLEYIIFEPEKRKINDQEHDFIRVYDDKEDKLYKIEGEKWVRQPKETFPNHWGYVPGIVISDLVDTVTGYKRSSIEEQIDLADEYLRDASVKTIYKFAHGFPLFWMYLQQCPHCKGEGEINAKTCNYCNGTGYSLKKDVSDIIGIKPPEGPDDVTITPDVAGYVTPPSENLEQMTNELKLLRDMMYFSHWGTVIQRGENETATGRFIDAMPVNDRLNQYADSIEDVEQKLTDIIGQFYFPNSYQSASINYGRRYIIETPDQLYDKYIKGREQGAHVVVQNYMVDQYFQAQFANDNFSLTIHRKLYDLDPFPNLNITDVPVNNLDYYKKLYLHEWRRTLKDFDIYKTPFQELDNKLSQYVKLKQLTNGTNEI